MRVDKRGYDVIEAFVYTLYSLKIIEHTICVILLVNGMDAVEIQDLVEADNLTAYL